MPLDNVQFDWVKKVAGGSDAVAAANNGRAAKEDLFAKAWAVIEPKVGQIKFDQNFVATLKTEGFAGFMRETFNQPQTISGMDPSRDSDQSFDQGQHGASVASIDPGQLSALMAAQAVIAEQVAVLRAAKDAVSGKNLLNDSEIAAEIWVPLMRRNIIPENAVPDRYSEVSRTFTGASAEYDTRIAAYTESLGDNDGLAAALGLTKETASALGGAAGSLMEMAKALNPGMKLDLGMATQICTAVTASASGVLEIGATIAKDGGITTKNVEKVAKSIVTAATGWVSVGFAQAYSGDTTADKIGQQIGSAINSGLKIGLSGTAFAAKVIEGKAAAAVEDLAAIVENCCACAGSSVATEANQKDSGKIAEIGSYTALTIKGFKELVVAAAAAKDGDVNKIAEALQSMVKLAVEKGAAKYKDVIGAKRPEGENDRAKQFDKEFQKPVDKARASGASAAVKDLDQLLKLAQTKSGAELKELFKTDPQLKGNATAQKLMEAVAKKRDEDLAAAGAQIADETGQEMAEFNNLLSGSEANDGDADTIERLILQIKKDQMLVSVAESMIKMGPAAAAAFFPPASIVVAVVDLALSMRKAAAHFMAWQEWQANEMDAASMRSVQTQAMANRAGLSAEKTAIEGIRSLEAAIRVLGEVCGTVGGPFAPVGMAVSKGVSAVGTLQEIILKFRDKAELKLSWDSYQAALSNPENRIAIRAAIKKNATLAKYVIAYGAVFDGNPVAKNALKKCGLSAKVLQSEGANVQKVVAYLETLYAEDPQVLEASPDAPNWHPGPVAFTAVSVAAFAHAMNDATPKPAKPLPLETPALMGQAEEAKTKLDLARTAFSQLPQQPPVGNGDDVDLVYTEALNGLLGALNARRSAVADVLGSCLRYDPKDTAGKPLVEVAAYAATLTRLARAQLVAVDRELELYE